MFTASAAEAVARGEIEGYKPHPWVLARVRELVGFGAGGRPLRVTIAGVRAMRTADLDAALVRAGVDADLSDFALAATEHASAWELSQDWRVARDADRELVGLVACELWRRRLPHRPSLEMLDEEMQRGYDAFERGATREAFDIWLPLWDALLEALPWVTTFDELDAEFDTGLNTVRNWYGDQWAPLRNASLSDPDLARRGRDVFARLAERLNAPEFQREVADRHFLLGDFAAGEAVLQAMIDEDPHDGWAWALLSDELAWAPRSAAHRDPGRAAALLEGALALPVTNAEACGLQGRLEQLRAAQQPPGGV